MIVLDVTFVLFLLALLARQGLCMVMFLVMRLTVQICTTHLITAQEFLLRVRVLCMSRWRALGHKFVFCVSGIFPPAGWCWDCPEA